MSGCKHAYFCWSALTWEPIGTDSLQRLCWTAEALQLLVLVSQPWGVGARSKKVTSVTPLVFQHSDSRGSSFDALLSCCSLFLLCITNEFHIIDPASETRHSEAPLHLILKPWRLTCTQPGRARYTCTCPPEPRPPSTAGNVPLRLGPARPHTQPVREQAPQQPHRRLSAEATEEDRSSCGH